MKIKKITSMSTKELKLHFDSLYFRLLVGEEKPTTEMEIALTKKVEGLEAKIKELQSILDSISSLSSGRGKFG